MAGRFKSVAELVRGVASGAIAADARTLGQLVEIVDTVGGIARRAWSARVIRPDDLLVLTFRAAGLQRERDRLRRTTPGVAAYLIVEHQTQSLADAAFLDTSGQSDFAGDKNLQGHEGGAAPPVATQPIPKPVPIRAAGPSRLAFVMPADEDALPLTLESLLDACRRWPLSLDPAAQSEPVDVRLADPFGLLTAELAEITRRARVGLTELLNPRLLAGLDTAAERLAAQNVDTLGTGRPIEDRLLIATAERQLAALLRESGGDETVRTAAQLYLRTATAERTVAGMQRARLSADLLGKLAPGYFGILQRPHEPGTSRTAIELPWRLIGSPLPGAGFTHAIDPVVHAGRTELWHTRLGTREVQGDRITVDDRAMRKLRYLWSPDYAAISAGGPTFSLDGLDRNMIVKLTTGYDEHLPNGNPFTPKPVASKRLTLSALGGLLDADQRWTTRPEGVDLRAWTHRLAQGRDAYVRVEYAGFLFPFGHAATLVKISERKFEWRGEKDRIALLRQRFFIVVREKTRAYPNGAPQPDLGRTMPFDAIEVTIDTTPNLDVPGGRPAERLSAAGFYTAERPFRMAFWPARFDATLYNFPLVGIDAAGRRIPFAMPLMFVSEVLNRAGSIEPIRDHYNGQNTRRTADTLNATMRFADVDDPAASDVDLPAASLLVRSANPTHAISATQATLLQQQPVIESARVKLASVERLTGQAKTPEVIFDPVYVANGFGGANASELFLKLKTPETLGFGSAGTGSDAVGGLATPDMKPAALSRRHGVMSGLGNLAANQFDPADFFAGAKLLGIFELSKILKIVPLGNESPRLSSTPLPAGGGLPDRIETVFRLHQDLPNSPIPELILNPDGTSSSFDLTATNILFADGRPPDATVEGILSHFKLNLAGVLIIHFDRLRFLKVTGRKPDVDVDLNPQTGVTFGGPLEFINTLKDYIPANGFSDPPDLQVTPQGITAGYALGLPAIQCGILSLSNISLGASFSLPFTGEAPTARFNFAERHNTFNLTVSLFGGGGFFAIVVGTGGVKEIEAALEFGAQVAINLGVASGSVYVKGGFYFHYAESPKRIEFEGYVELGGRLSVLGLISVSLTFHLSLTYESKQLPDKADGSPHAQSRLFGQASLVVEIEILFFSISVSVKVEKTFAGSESDPLFKHFIPDQSTWDDYCSAFA